MNIFGINNFGYINPYFQIPAFFSSPYAGFGMLGFNSIFSLNNYYRQNNSQTNNSSRNTERSNSHTRENSGNYSPQYEELNSKINAFLGRLRNKNFNGTEINEPPKITPTVVDRRQSNITTKPQSEKTSQGTSSTQPVRKPTQTKPAGTRRRTRRSTPTVTTSAVTSAQQTPSAVSPVVKRALELAEAEIGVKENGHSNDSTRVRVYKNGAINNKPWCGSFASWLFGAGQNGTNSGTFGYSMHSQEIRRRAQAAGHYATKDSGYLPQVGDLMIIKYPDQGGHVGIITKVNDNGTFETVEGNYSNGVNRVNRSMSTADLHGFVKMNEWLQA